MTDQEKREKKNRRIGLLTSLGVHAALLLLFLFAMAWRAPDPPLPEFGIIVNVGFDDAGSGDVQTDKPATEPTTEQEDQQTEDIPQETQSDPQPVVEDKPVDKVEQEEVITSKIESPVTAKKEEEKVKEKPKEEPKKEEPKKEPEKIKTEYTKENAEQAKTSDHKGEKTESEGDDKDKTGNKGQPDGTLDPNGQYTGKPGGGAGGNGISLTMSGWTWSKQPNTSGISNNESGRIVFEIECDDSGEIIGIKTLERGVSAATEQILRSAIQNTSLIRNTTVGQIPERSKGTVTFVVKSR
jgi:protein TonB